MFKTLVFIFIFSLDLLAATPIVASNINPDPANLDLTTIVLALFSFVIFLFGMKKVLNFLG